MRPGAVDVLREEIAGETELGVVGDADGFVVGFEADQRRDRAEISSRLTRMSRVTFVSTVGV